MALPFVRVASEPPAYKPASSARAVGDELSFYTTSDVILKSPAADLVQEIASKARSSRHRPAVHLENVSTMKKASDRRRSSNNDHPRSGHESAMRSWSGSNSDGWRRILSRSSGAPATCSLPTGLASVRPTSAPRSSSAKTIPLENFGSFSDRRRRFPQFPQRLRQGPSSPPAASIWSEMRGRHPAGLPPLMPARVQGPAHHAAPPRPLNSSSVISRPGPANPGGTTVGTARGPVWNLLQRPVGATQVRFLDHFTERQADGTRRIKRRSERFLTVGREERQRIWKAVERRGFEVLDVAFRVPPGATIGAGATSPWSGSKGLMQSESFPRHRGGRGLAYFSPAPTRNNQTEMCPMPDFALVETPAPAAGEADRLPGRPRRRWAGVPDARTDPRGESHRSGPAPPASEAASPRRGDRGEARGVGPYPRLWAGRPRPARRPGPVGLRPRARCRDRLGSPLCREDAAGLQGILSIRRQVSLMARLATVTLYNRRWPGRQRPRCA